MLVLEEGDEFYVEDQERWAEFQPKVGTIIEVDGASTDHSFPPGLWLAFVVMGVQLDADSSLIVEVKFVGSEEAVVNKELSLSFNRRKGFLHLCSGKPCLSDAEVTMHVTRFRCYSVEGYKKDFLTPAMVRQMRKWAGVNTEAPPDGEGQKALPRKSARKTSAGTALTRAKEADALSGAGGDPTAAGRLGARLMELRHRLSVARPPKGNTPIPPDPSGDVEEVESSSEENTDFALPALETGTEIAELEEKKKIPKKMRPTTKRKVKKDASKILPWDRGDRLEEAGGGQNLLAIKDGSSKGIQSQLALRAAAVAKEKSRKRERSKKSSGSSIGKQLIKLLTGKKDKKGKGSSKDKKKSQRRKRRAKIKPDPDGNGPTDSSESSYSSSSKSDVDSLSEDELEPPLRKRAKQHPGSVLKMLLNHARAQLDQSSKVALDPNMNVDVLTGVKMASYFAICVKPTLSQNLGAQRDLHLLSVAIDLLRQGDLTLLGDCLASRFVAIHQAAVDGGWQAARHLELFPMEEGGATNNARPPRNQEACEAGRESGRPGCLPMERLRKRKRREEGQERKVGRPGALRERIRKERERWKRAQGRLESRRSEQMEGEQRHPRQEVGATEIADIGGFEAGHFARALVGAQVGLAGLVFENIILHCRNFKCTGCVLAWMVIRGRTLPAAVFEELGFPKGIFQHVAAKTKEIAPRKKGASFPLREGELSALVLAMNGFTLVAATSPENVKEWATDAWRFLVFGSLNYLHSGSAGLAPGRWSASDRTVAATVGDAAFRRMAHDHEGVMTLSEWEKDIGGKLVGYGGEEVSRCFELSLDQVLPSLPLKEHGGSIEAIDWVGHRTRRFLLDPKLVLKDHSEVTLPRMPGKIHMKTSDRVAIGNELIARNICEWIDVDQVYRVGGVPVLNGLFGVEKSSKLADGRAVLRIIMNLTGSNSTQENN